MAVIEASVPALRWERANQQPNETAFTYIDYGLDSAGFAESHAWSQVHRRAQVVAEELRAKNHARKMGRVVEPVVVTRRVSISYRSGNDSGN